MALPHQKSRFDLFIRIIGIARAEAKLILVNIAYNFTRRLKTFQGRTIYEFICKRWTSEPERLIITPIHQMPGPKKLVEGGRAV